jgi:hypothetical protein
MAANPTLPPGLPEIQDDAAKTPLWVPGLGLALFMVAAFVMIFSAMNTEEDALDAEVTAEAAEVADEVEAALEPAPSGH